MCIINVLNVSKSFGHFKVLNNINLSINKGEILGLIGPSGSGKTTLVKSILGMERINDGSINVLNYTVPNFQILKKIGYMAQSDALYEELSGKENLEFFGKLYGLNSKDLSDRIKYTASLVNLEKDLLKRVGNYSGGMKRRLSLAITLIHDPDILILDEPTVGIDPRLRYSIWTELYHLKKQGKTIILTTHVMDEAEKCDKLALIRDGEILAEGSILKLKKMYNVDSIEAIFL